MVKRQKPEIFPTDRLTLFSDEVGRGAWAHDLVACAVHVPEESFTVLLDAGVRDSKAFADSKGLTAHQKRQEIATLVMQHTSWTVGRASAQEIDDTDIDYANNLAIARAVSALEEQIGLKSERIVLDGNRKNKLLSQPQTLVEKGDARFLQLAAASIVAKVIRDSEMLLLHQRYPWYGWDTNKGYGGVDKNRFSKHLEGLRSHGAIPGLHRMSFAGIHLFKKRIDLADSFECDLAAR